MIVDSATSHLQETGDWQLETGDSQMKLSIVIPARNEEGNIGSTLKLLREHLDGAGVSNFEIVVVDDGSKDRTGAEVVETAGGDERIRCRM